MRKKHNPITGAKTMTEERCKECGHIIHLDKEAAAKSRENGRKGGRPVNPDSKRQIKIRKRLDKYTL